MVFAAGVLTRFDASQGLPYESRQLTRTIGQTSAPTSQDSIALEGNNVIDVSTTRLRSVAGFTAFSAVSVFVGCYEDAIDIIAPT